MKSKHYWEEWDKVTLESFRKDFIAWYEKEKRNLPWRVNLDPYRIWISEIMLQQTRVDTVIDYYYRFMKWFPTVQALAEASEDKLLKAWEGLGYYSRARNLKIAANQIMTDFNGKMPETITEIRQLKGIGPYTAGAIASIAFQVPEPAIDGNVMRVVSRLFEINEDIAKASSRKIFEQAMYKIIDQERPGDFNQALMDLGSSICTPRSPKCEECPIQEYCLAYKKNTTANFPIKAKKIKPKDVYYIAGIIENKQQEFLLSQRESTGLLANMWLFPTEEVTKKQFDLLKKNWEKENQQMTLDLLDKNKVAEEEKEIFTDYCQVVWQKRIIGEVTHVFSHLKWHILVFYGRQTGPLELQKNQRWIFQKDFPNFVFPKPQQKMLELLENEQEKME